MKSTTRCFLAVAFLTAPSLALQAQESKAPAAKPDAAAPAAPTAPTAPTPAETIASTDEAALGAAKGKTVTVTGAVKNTRKMERGLSFVNLEGGFTLVCFEKDYAAFTAGHPTEIYKGKVLAVTGEVSEYRGKLQIKLTGPAMVKVTGDIPAEAKTEGGEKGAKGGKGQPKGDAKEGEADDGQAPKKERKRRTEGDKQSNAISPAPFFDSNQ